MNGDTTERISQKGQCPKDGFNGLLARASAFVGGVLSSIQAIAGTTTCKGVQIARLKDWAIKLSIKKGKNNESLPLPITFILLNKFYIINYQFLFTKSIIAKTSIL